LCNCAQVGTVDFSKLKVELYDFFGILIPGFLLICDLWIATLDTKSWVEHVNALSGTMIAILALFSYVLGHLVQEAGDAFVHAITHSRYLKKSRDEFWKTADGSTIRQAIRKESGFDIASVDMAYDYCLSKVKATFTKRDAFVVTSDLARSFILLSVPTGICATVALYKRSHSAYQFLAGLGTILVILTLATWISWRRMMRFRDFADRPVFAAYLASMGESKNSNTDAKN